MSAMTFLSGTFCGKEIIIEKILKKSSYNILSDQDLIDRASQLSGIPGQKINNVFFNKTSVFNRFTHEKERSLAYLRLALAQALSGNNFLIDGFAGVLIPHSVSHVLRICLIADMKHRIAQAMKEKRMSEKEACAHIQKDDEVFRVWIDSLYKMSDPWDTSLYDIIIPTDKMTDKEIISLIDSNLKSEVIQPTKASMKAAEDFLQAAHVEVALSNEGHAVDVSVRDGHVTLTIHTNVLLLSRLEEELKSIAGKVEGVNTVETRIGKGFYKADIYRKYDFQVPSKVLLVDDEREFVQTLSERLQMRDMGSAVAYDGESALNLVAEDEPDVMILDLKMPGIDGIEVLKKVKTTQPDIEVIILTGHGSEADKEICMQLGAYAYFQKPVDIDLLSQALKAANKKIQDAKKQKS
ncbi:response regulator [Desulfobacula phenolica]|uniref:DNA-binding transcriptional response regulator, NtrC family, contains REC, AAA-type ATPase, and a Fis-type DNA-binding domains n=1 Tax=Desulfobacula phenolica TaxID=90732 RepID=A0A1H2DLN0_9BACT|nr:response regulator [Desulfobacula phenolica]SDT83805.1 DNA-binding transcriptional response regulator, NtrC family, contains REC, AAA-type ATPase, and a Fis-type DNA-binding domains [Desulfobacula phenolica]